MSFISEAQGAIDTAAHFTTLEDRISKLEEKNQELEKRLNRIEVKQADKAITDTATGNSMKYD
ncbi:MAG: hypothetical protein ACYTXT_41075 [Nostoc sp.]